jgi:hypothetical protein
MTVESINIPPLPPLEDLYRDFYHTIVRDQATTPPFGFFAVQHLHSCPCTKIDYAACNCGANAIYQKLTNIANMIRAQTGGIPQ